MAHHHHQQFFRHNVSYQYRPGQANTNHQPGLQQFHQGPGPPISTSSKASFFHNFPLSGSATKASHHLHYHQLQLLLPGVNSPIIVSSTTIPPLQFGNTFGQSLAHLGFTSTLPLAFSTGLHYSSSIIVRLGSPPITITNISQRGRRGQQIPPGFSFNQSVLPSSSAFTARHHQGFTRSSPPLSRPQVSNSSHRRLHIFRQSSPVIPPRLPPLISRHQQFV